MPDSTLHCRSPYRLNKTRGIGVRSPGSHLPNCAILSIVTLSWNSVNRRTAVCRRAPRNSHSGDACLSMRRLATRHPNSLRYLTSFAPFQTQTDCPHPRCYRTLRGVRDTTFPCQTKDDTEDLTRPSPRTRIVPGGPTGVFQLALPNVTLTACSASHLLEIRGEKAYVGPQ